MISYFSVNNAINLMLYFAILIALLIGGGNR